MGDGDALAQFEQGVGRVESEYPSAFEAAQDEPALRAIKARFIGPSGDLTQLLKLMPSLPRERRRELGGRANQVKQAVQAAFDACLAGLAQKVRQADLQGPALDVSLAGRGLGTGHLHPISQITAELVDIFSAIGFELVDGPEAELSEYNFDKLGFPPDHPATDMQDSFYLDGYGKRALLRTHTSTVQVREMLRRQPPLAIIAPGKVYRRDDDATHSPMFHQLEGLLVDEGVSFADLKGVLTLFVRRLFGDVDVRFRPSYFPFVEPGGELDIAYGHGDKWMEVLGCGMVHPVVLENVGYDPERYTGFAFGMGIDRIAMLKFGIDNIRLMFENDPRFLAQF